MREQFIFIILSVVFFSTTYAEEVNKDKEGCVVAKARYVKLVGDKRKKLQELINKKKEMNSLPAGPERDKLGIETTNLDMQLSELYRKVEEAARTSTFDYQASGGAMGHCSPPVDNEGPVLAPPAPRPDLTPPRIR